VSATSNRCAGLGSFGVHLAAVGAIYAWHALATDAAHGPAPPPAPTIEISIAPRAPPAPRPTTALEPPRTVVTAPTPTPRRAPAPPAIGALELAGSRSSEVAARVFRMRGPELRYADEVLVSIATAGSAGRPADPAPSGRLVPHGREWLARDRVAPMHVQQDGTVAFETESDFALSWTLPLPSSPRRLGDLLEAWYRDPYAQTTARRVRDMPKHEQAVEGGWDAGAGGDGQPNGKLRDNGRPAIGFAVGGTMVPLAGGSFGLTAWAMRQAHVGDPYVARKRVLIEATSAERVEIGVADRERQLARTAELMRRNLIALADQQLPPAELRTALFALWDECAEGDDPAGEAGGRARAMVLGWIRGHLPADSVEAFTGDELARLDRTRTSSEPFAPYATVPPR